jgi:outer membrane immunogenic protein
MKKLLVVGIAATFWVAPAIAADLPVKAGPLLPAPTYNSWTGCYIGGNVGEAWVRKGVSEVGIFTTVENSPLSPASGSGLAYGGQVGCDYQVSGTWVFGVRGMWDGTNVKGSSAGPSQGGGQIFNFDAQSFATAVARLGYLLTPQLMLYGVGGVASTHDRYSIVVIGPADSGSVSESRTGYDVGAGVAWMLNSNWDFWVEYDYMNFGTSNVGFITNGLTPNLPITNRISETEQKILVGLDFRFTNLVK